MSNSNAEQRFNNEWGNYFSDPDNTKDLITNDNLKYEEHKALLDKYEKRSIIYEELLKLEGTLHSNNIDSMPRWLCEGIEQSLRISQSTQDSTKLSEKIDALESRQKAFDNLLRENKRVDRLIGEQKIGTPLHTVSNELEYLAEITARTLSSLKSDRAYLNLFGQPGRKNAETIRFGKSLALYFYESIWMKLDGTVAHITNAVFSLPNENYGELLGRDSVREWTKGINWSEQDLKT